MLKKEKKSFKKLKGKSERKPFFELLVNRLNSQGGKRLDRWLALYRRKCEKKGVPCPLDKLDLPNT